MSLTLEQIHTIARLAKLSLNEEEASRMQQHLNEFFASVVSPMQAVDTSNITPLAHPVEIFHDVALRLRDDVASEPNNREANQRSAPQVQDGLFLVPKVIE
ncbi:MAG: Asp-tRNA(Asn)/Glu-tRNA(Gln) amidotransferase subunit GatC [Brachymonas sp.]|nr:Asp-tRNA(Asn)/Glu-tRNA(Gln) amidotransferase subunit GatC [Brachymonas sp.]